jgi:hypothetical protein
MRWPLNASGDSIQTIDGLVTLQLLPHGFYVKCTRPNTFSGVEMHQILSVYSIDSSFLL